MINLVIPFEPFIAKNLNFLSKNPQWIDMILYDWILTDLTIENETKSQDEWKGWNLFSTHDNLSQPIGFHLRFNHSLRRTSMNWHDSVWLNPDSFDNWKWNKEPSFFLQEEMHRKDGICFERMTSVRSQLAFIEASADVIRNAWNDGIQLIGVINLVLFDIKKKVCEGSGGGSALVACSIQTYPWMAEWYSAWAKDGQQVRRFWSARWHQRGSYSWC